MGVLQGRDEVVPVVSAGVGKHTWSDRRAKSMRAGSSYLHNSIPEARWAQINQKLVLSQKPLHEGTPNELNLQVGLRVLLQARL